MRRLTQFALALGLCVVIAGCGSTASPSPTPGSIDVVIADIVLQDVTVLRLISGDPGCSTSALHDNAVHLVLAVGAQSVAHDVYLLRWRKPADFDAAAGKFAECLAEYTTAHPGSNVGSLEVRPWRAYGPLWTGQLRSILENALRRAGGG